MDRRERSDNLNEALLAAFDGWQAKLWTALPCIIQSFDPVHMTVTAQPAIQAKVRNAQGVESDRSLPLLVDVPVCFPGGGGFTLTSPIVKGDEALVIFSSRCIDAWWDLSGIQVQSDVRMHNLSDGFAIIGVRSRPRGLPTISTTSTQLRSDDGLAYIEMAGGHIANIVAPGGINLNGVTIDATGNLMSPTTITAPNVVGTTNVTFGGKSGVGHTHSDPQGGNTGVPN